MYSKSEILQKTILNIAVQFDISVLQLSKILEVNDIVQILEGSKEAESAMVLINIYKKLYSVTNGDVNTMRIFIHSNNKLINAIPLEVLQTKYGLTTVFELLRFFQYS